MNYFLWTEDSTAGKEFWGLVSRLRYNNQLNVESKGNNEDLVKAVELLDPDVNSKYFIAFDIVNDNPNMVALLHRANNLKARHLEKIIWLPMFCFEYLVCSFFDIQEWTCTRNTKAGRLINEFVNSVNHYQISPDLLRTNEAIKFLGAFENKSSERVFKSLASQITRINDWSVDGRLGECWHKDCCTINNENVKIFKPGKCVKVPPNGDERILKLIQSAEVLKVLKPIDNAILTRDKNKTNEMEIF